MATAVIECRVTGTLDTEDRRAMLFIVNQENARRAALTPPGEQLSVADNTAIRTSYQTAQTSVLVAAHSSYIQQSNIASLADIRAVWDAATDQQRNAALAALQ